LWVPVDLYVFDAPLGAYMCGLRVLATMAFAGLALSFRRSDSMSEAHHALAVLLAVPTTFFLIGQPILARFELHTAVQRSIAASYAFLPFIMVAGISVFPVTALEGVALSAPLLIASLVVALFGFEILPFASQLGELWLLVVIAMVATLAGMSQLHFMMQLVRQASHDILTMAYTRYVGEELLDAQFSLAQRNDAPFAVAFIDLDNFKRINDQFGHDEGDNAIRQAALSLRRTLRRADLLVRWGGEEFLVVMPNTDGHGANVVIQRLCDLGLGHRPDGLELTASIGVAERLVDDCRDWMRLVEIADQRMYAAKQSGKGRVITIGDEVLA
jgi:diguanylate cyclase (GGDEF)-like protein